MAVDSTRVTQMLRQLPQIAVQRLYTVMVKIGLDLQGWVQQQKLQGQVLNHRTGWLSSHVHAKTERQGAARVITTVGVDGKAVPYARIHEFGFDGNENVKAHQRTISMVFGRPITPMQIQVGAFSRHMKMPERSYLRSSLADRKRTYIDWIKAAI